jgi:hypothetical protein
MGYSKLAPPILGGIVPAFYSEENGIACAIPFSMNRVVNLGEVNGFQIKIKTMKSNTELYTVWVPKATNQGHEIEFTIPITSASPNKFNKG